jgi:outer membrane protein OmpA-like peptidoglycan-associated protein
LPKITGNRAKTARPGSLPEHRFLKWRFKTMFKRYLAAGFALMLTPYITSAAPDDGWTTAPNANCSDIGFGEVVTSRFPEAERACRRVVLDDAGNPYVEIQANVHHVRRDPRSRSMQNVTLDLLDSEGEVLRKLSIRPPRGFRFKVDGETYDADYLTRGTELTLFLPSDRWEVVWSPETATPISTQVYIEDIDTRLVTISLRADEAFKFDSAELSVAGKRELDGIHAASGEYVPAISVFGYTDSIGDESYNLDLSQRRADAAKAYLVSLGVPEWRVTAVGRGEDYPIVDCEGESGEELKSCLAPNRRAEVAFLVPAISDVMTAKVTKTYVKPLGGEVTITEEVRVAQLGEISAQTATFLDTCKAEISAYCEGVVPGDGRLIGCLNAHDQPDMGFSAACEAVLDEALDSLMFRRARLEAVAADCSAEINACSAAPFGSKLECMEQEPKSEQCAAAMANLADSAL